MSSYNLSWEFYPFIEFCSLGTYRMSIILSLGFFFFFCGIGIWTQCLGALCFWGMYSTPWAMLPALFALGDFVDRVLFVAQAGLDYDPPMLCFPSSLGWWAHTTTFSFFPLSWGSYSLFFLTRIAWNHDPPNLSSQIARITSMSHWHQAHLSSFYE
jgi:hypothetical protein